MEPLDFPGPAKEKPGGHELLVGLATLLGLVAFVALVAYAVVVDVPLESKLLGVVLLCTMGAVLAAFAAVDVVKKKERAALPPALRQIVDDERAGR